MALGSTGPVETKVKVAAVASAAATLVVWAINHYLVTMPAEVELSVQIIVVGIVTFGAGFLVNHTPRDDVDAVGPPGKRALDGDPDERPASGYMEGQP